MPVWWRDLVEGPALAEAGILSVHPTAIVAHDATLDTSNGSITVGPRTRICGGAHIQGPVTIGADCLVGNLVLLRGTTVIGDGTRIGFATEIKNARIAEVVTIGPQ